MGDQLHSMQLEFTGQVPTKYGGFCAKLGLYAKSTYLQQLLESKRKNRSSDAFFRDN